MYQLDNLSKDELIMLVLFYQKSLGQTDDDLQEIIELVLDSIDNCEARKNQQK